MAANTRIQVRRGYSVGYPGSQIGPTPLTAIWTNSIQLSEGEIGYEIDTGRFKIGKYIDGTLATWQNLPYAGGSNILPGYSSTSGVGSGISTQYNESTNSYTIHNSIVTSGNGISLSATSITGNGLTAPTGSGWSFGLSNRLQTLSNLTSSGIIVGINASGVTTRSLSDGDNITITNRDGINNNPVISLNSSVTGLSSISGVNNFTIASNSGINFNAGAGVVSVDDLTVNGATNLNGNINIGLAAQILATGPIVFSGNPVAFVGQTLFDRLPKVGPTGNNGANATGVSLVGHSHEYADITDFCDGVASCVDTAMSPSTGIQFSYGAGTLSVALSGQALRLHNLNTDGLIVRSGENILARSITASGSNIFVGIGNGVSGNPNIGLNPDVSVATLSTSSSATIGTNLTVEGNLIVNGDTVTTNVSTIQVEDPTIRVGASSTGTLSSSDTKDRGIEFIYRRSGTVPITGFFGYDHSEDAFVFLKNSANSGETYTGTSGLVNVGGLYSAGGVSGTILTSTVSSPNAPIVVTSTGLVSNLNADFLDGQDGSYYRNGVNITGTISSGVLPDISSAFTLTASSPTSGYNFVNALTVDRAGRLLSAKSGIIPTATSADIGLAKFSTDNFAVTNGDVTIKDGGVILGTETSGQYAKTVSVAGTGLTATTANATHDTSYTITSNATPGGTTGTIVARNTSDGGFTAGTITATGFVGYGGSITGLYANNLTSGTVPSGRLTGNYDISILGNAETVTSGVYTSRNINTASGISGGGNLGSDLNLKAVAGTGITVDTNGIHINTSVVVATTGTQTVSGVKTFENAPVFNSGLSLKNTAASSVSGFAVFANDSTGGTARTLDYRSLSGVRTDLGASANTASTLVLRDSSGNFSASTITVTGLITESVSGSLTSGIYKSSSISGINSSTYLHNFIIDGGTP